MEDCMSEEVESYNLSGTIRIENLLKHPFSFGKWTANEFIHADRNSK
jgi:hypothetical protein